MTKFITLLVLSFAMVFATNAADDTKDGKEKTWSIGIGKKGVEVNEVDNASESDSGPKRQSHRARTFSIGGGSIDDDPRWSKASSPICLTGNIDVAYVRIKKEFDYDTPEERLAATPGARGDLDSIKRREGFEYVAQPGVYYLMRDKNRHTGNRVIQAELAIDGDNQYCMEFGFVNVGLSNPNQYSKELRARLIAAVN